MATDTISTIKATLRKTLDVNTTGVMIAPTKPMAGHNRTKATEILGRTAAILTIETTTLDINSALAETLVLLLMEHPLRGLQPRAQIIIGDLLNLTGRTREMGSLQATQGTRIRRLCNRNGTCATDTQTSVGRMEKLRSAGKPRTSLIAEAATLIQLHRSRR